VARRPFPPTAPHLFYFHGAERGGGKKLKKKGRRRKKETSGNRRSLSNNTRRRRNSLAISGLPLGEGNEHRKNLRRGEGKGEEQPSRIRAIRPGWSPLEGSGRGGKTFRKREEEGETWRSCLLKHPPSVLSPLVDVFMGKGKSEKGRKKGEPVGQNRVSEIPHGKAERGERSKEKGGKKKGKTRSEVIALIEVGNGGDHREKKGKKEKKRGEGEEITTFLSSCARGKRRKDSKKKRREGEGGVSVATYEIHETIDR